MAFDLTDVLAGVRASRSFFLKHVDGLTPEQWSWKPYPGCKGVRETLVHLIVGDRMAMNSLKTGGMPEDFEGFIAAIDSEAADDTNEELIARVNRERETLLAYIEETYAGKELDAPTSLYGGGMKLGAAAAYLSGEDFYHAGQIAFIRLATNPDWNYYGEIYGF